MMKLEQSKLLTDTAPGTPGGEMFRRYWHPILLSKEVPPGGRPVPVTILGEPLVVFRDENDEVGVLYRHCCHRQSDLSFGRIEDGGLRCLYHGWLFDRNGKCLETPGEPRGTKLHEKVCQPAYPCREAAGAIFAYLGPDEPPLFPNYEPLLAPPEHIYNMKALLRCNYLQSMEGNTDPIHTGFLHRPSPKLLADQERKMKAMGGKAPAVAGTANDKDVFQLLTTINFRPIKTEATHFGNRVYCERELDDGRLYFRVLSWAVPNVSAVVATEHRAAPGGGCMMLWNVPIDEFTHWRFEFYYQRMHPVDPKFYEDSLEPHVSEDYTHVRNPDNRYMQDPEAMDTENFTGMGPFFPVHDAAVTESMGPVADRTKEHLGTSDIGVRMNRRCLFKAIEAVQEGKDPQNVIRDPAENDYSQLVALNAVVDDEGKNAEEMFRDQYAGIEKDQRELGRIPDNN